MTTEDKLLRLRQALAALDSVVVAFSGGVDSTLLLRVCVALLGEKVLAVTADSPLHPARELEEAVTAAASMAARHVVVRTVEMQDPGFTSNPPDRCYRCKRILLEELGRMAAANGIRSVVEGSNADDRDDYRPGARAADELGVGRPLQEVGLTKAEIRAVSREMGLAAWNKPSLACLATRIPYGSPITAPALASVDAAEAFIRSLGVGQVRVRHYGRMARIEVAPEDVEKLGGEIMRGRLVSHLKGLGYGHVALDLEGYRTGSMNEEVLW